MPAHEPVLAPAVAHQPLLAPALAVAHKPVLALAVAHTAPALELRPAVVAVAAVAAGSRERVVFS